MDLRCVILKSLRLPVSLSHSGICHTGADMSHTNITYKMFTIMIGYREENEFLVPPGCWAPVAVFLPLRLSPPSKVKVVYSRRTEVAAGWVVSCVASLFYHVTYNKVNMSDLICSSCESTISPRVFKGQFIFFLIRLCVHEFLWHPNVPAAFACLVFVFTRLVNPSRLDMGSYCGFCVLPSHKVEQRWSRCRFRGGGGKKQLNK